MISKDRLKEELDFCIKTWGKQGFCSFGGHTKCEECATPYLMYKLLTNNLLHDKNMKRLSLHDWKELLAAID
ncbi:hypothetical protein KAW80_01150 [Candidatus Babeliales bacterium]|nr:hypothetical protein [Candidatus Babeliales bacterium]